MTNNYTLNYFKQRLQLLFYFSIPYLLINSILIILFYFIFQPLSTIYFFGYPLLPIDLFLFYFILLLEGFIYVSNIIEQRCHCYNKNVLINNVEESDSDIGLQNSLQINDQNGLQNNLQNGQLQEEFVVKMTIENRKEIFQFFKRFCKDLFFCIIYLFCLNKKYFIRFCNSYLLDRKLKIKQIKHLLLSFKIFKIGKKSYFYFPLFYFICLNCLQNNYLTNIYIYYFKNIIFCISYFIGLQFTYLDKIKFFQQFGDRIVNSTRWKEITFIEIILFLLIMILFIAIFILQFIFLFINYNYSIFLYFILFYSFTIMIISLIYLKNCKLYKTIYFHFHHYFISLFLIPFFFGKNNYFIGTIGSGICLGIYVEGITRWGMHAILIMKEKI